MLSSVSLDNDDRQNCKERVVRILEIMVNFFNYNINKEFGAWNMFAGYGLVDAYNAVKTTPRK